MGIMSLTSFLDGFPGLLAPYRLHDTQVVIDGNNLCHALYHDSSVSSFFGGDYDKFGRRIKEYFKIYAKCGIKPIIIFDGAYNERKLNTSLKRAEERQVIAKHLSRGKHAKSGDRNRILPILAMDVFQDVLSDIKIPYVQSDFEADPQIAAIANHYQCPVLSLDSDFYIFDVKCGFIPLNLIDMHLKQITEESIHYKFLDCKIYYVDNFLEQFDTLDRTVLPLFGTLLGNDFVSTSLFSHFFAQLNIRHLKLTKYNFGMRHQKIIGLLTWLQTRTREEAINQILNFFKKEKRHHLKDVIEESVVGYSQIESSKVLRVLTKDPSQSDKKSIDDKKNEENEDDIAMPKWFVDKFNEGILSPFMLNAIIHRRISLLAQTENQDLPSSYAISRPIRCVIYGLLYRIKQNFCKKRVDELCVKEYDRLNCGLQNVTTKAIDKLSTFGSLPLLPDIDSHKARMLLLEVLEADDTVFPTCPSGLRFILLIIRYWIIKAEPRVVECELYSVVLCILYLSTFDVKAKFKKSFSTFNAKLDEVFEKVSINEFKTIASKLNKFRNSSEFTRIRHFNVAVVHNFSQLQTCCLYAFNLNRLLNFPFTSVSISKLYNGTFLYHTSVALQSRADPLGYVREVLNDHSAAVDVFNHIMNLILASLPTNVTIQKSYRSTKKRQKKKCKTDLSTKKEVPDTDESSESLENVENGNNFEIAVDICNKFEALIN